MSREKLHVGSKDKMIAANFAPCQFKEFSSDPFGLKSARGPYPGPPLHELVKCVSGNLSDCPKQLVDFIMKGIELALKENHQLRWGRECLDGGRIRVDARRMTSMLLARSAALS
jgi:hypothetical protein